MTKDNFEFYEDPNWNILIFKLLRKGVEINSLGVKTINRESSDKQKEDFNFPPPVKKRRDRIQTDWSESKLHEIEEEKSDDSSEVDGRMY